MPKAMKSYCIQICFISAADSKLCINLLNRSTFEVWNFLWSSKFCLQRIHLKTRKNYVYFNLQILLRSLLTRNLPFYNIFINRYRLDYIKVSVQQIICMMRSAIYQDIFIAFFLMHNSHTQIPHIDRRSAREPSFLHIILLNDFFILFIKLFSIQVISF